jgi:tetratricopeptide (TPR) repeat protein
VPETPHQAASDDSAEQTQPASSAEQETKAPISLRRRRLFIAFCLVLPFILVLTAEGVLRLCGFGGYPPVIKRIADVEGGTLYTTYVPGAASYFDTRKTIPGSIAQTAFVDPKPGGTVRVVLVGGSAIKGFPQSPAFAPSAFLEVMLEDVWPGKDVEVINLGTTAVASFPALGMLEEMLPHKPDLVVIYTGHNEFYGAYGVASLQTAGSSTRAMRLRRRIGGWAIPQAIASIGQRYREQGDKALMEAMVGRGAIAANDPLRAAATGSLRANVARMIAKSRAAGSAVMVCTLPVNERGMAPIGGAPEGTWPADVEAFVEAHATEPGWMIEDLDGAADELQAMLEKAPTHARLHFWLGQTHLAAGNDQAALAEFEQAVDLDPMPWRAGSARNKALANVAKAGNAWLCDVRQAFREASPRGSIGWELLDDHVHPGLEGQALIARAIVERLTTVEGPLHVDPQAFAALPETDVYLERLHDNNYERYSVAHLLRTIFDVPFMRQSNPQGFARYDRICKALMAKMPIAACSVVAEWQKPGQHRYERRPLSGMVGRLYVRDKQYAEAEKLYASAEAGVPAYSTWNFEYVYFRLVCRKQLKGAFTSDDVKTARDAIERIDVLLKYGDGNPGLCQRFKGRLLQLCGDWAESIEPLSGARKHLWEMELVANDAALIEAYMRTGRTEEARGLAEEGIGQSGEFARYYRQFLDKINAAAQGSSP